MPIDDTIAELQAYLVKVNDGLAGFQFLADGNTGQPAVHDPLEETVVAYEDQKKLTEDAIESLTELQGSSYPDLPKMATSQEIVNDIDNDLRQAAFAKEQIAVAAGQRRFS